MLSRETLKRLRQISKNDDSLRYVLELRRLKQFCFFTNALNCFTLNSHQVVSERTILINRTG